MKRSAVTVAGGALIIGGVALMVLPGAGILLVDATVDSLESRVTGGALPAIQRTTPQN